MNNFEFINIENVKEYLIDGLNCGKFKIETYKKVLSGYCKGR